MKTFVSLIVVVGVVAGLPGCSGMFRTNPEAAHVTVTTNPGDVAGRTHIAFGHAKLGALMNQNKAAVNYARNFTHQSGGNIALMKMQLGGYSQYGPTMFVTVDAYR